MKKVFKMFAFMVAFFLVFTGCAVLEKKIEEETPFGALYYPKEYENMISFEQKEENGVHIVEFHGEIEGKEKQHLFDIIFGESEGYKVGEIDGVSVSVFSYDLNTEGWSEEEQEQIYAMQEKIDFVLKNIEKIRKFRNLDELLSENKNSKKNEKPMEVMNVFETPYGNICYPMEWTEYLKIEQVKKGETYSIVFKGIIGKKDVEIFEIVFGNYEGVPVGVIKDGDDLIDIYVIPKEPESDMEFTEEETEKFYEIQSIIDHVLQEVAAFENAEIIT